MAGSGNTRRGLNYWIDWSALVAGAVVFATGIVLLTQFHMGHGTLNPAAMGVGRLAWLNIHRLTALFLLAGVLGHTVLHWRTICIRVSRVWSKLPGRASRADLILYFGFAIELVAGFTSWLFLPGSAPLAGPVPLGPLEHSRHICIDLHNFAGLLLLPAAIIHVRRHWRFLFPTARFGRTLPIGTPSVAGRMTQPD
jgi:hypothetical protein